MNHLLTLSSWMYDRLLILYPEDLRRDIGVEMALAFADDLESGWHDARLAGVVQIWWYALRELMTVALPGQTSNPCVLVPVLSFVMAASTLGAEITFAFLHARRWDGSLLLDAVLMAVFLPSLLSALVGFIVARLYARCPITSLQLE
jgi:hypothetical protein